MFDWAISHLERQVHVVTSAPLPFAISVALAALILIGIFSVHYENRFRDRLETKDAQIGLLQERLNQALGQVNSSNSGTEAAPQLARPERSLTQDQITAIRSSLSPNFTENVLLPISAEGGCDSCITLQNELGFALSNLPNVNVGSSGILMGVTNAHPTGLLIIAPSFDDPDSFPNQLSRAFTKAGLEHGTRVGRLEMPNMVARIDVTKPRKY